MLLYCKTCQKIFSTYNVDQTTSCQFTINTIDLTKEEKSMGVIDYKFYCPIITRHEIQMVYYVNTLNVGVRQKISNLFRRAIVTREDRELEYIDLTKIKANELMLVKAAFTESLI